MSSNTHSKVGCEVLIEKRVPGQDYRKIIYREGHDHFVALTRSPIKRDGELKLWGVVKMPPELYCPIAPANVKIASEYLLSTCHIKYPPLQAWPKLKTGEMDYLKARTLREVSICEHITKNPHPNLAEYVGCIVEDGFIKAIVYEKYEETLLGKVNPERIRKSHFEYGEYPLERSCATLLTEISRGLNHLHSLGLVHNDVKPENIMLNFEGAAIIIDFDSCLPIGACCSGVVGRTMGWANFDLQLSLPSNDLSAVDEIAEWLSDKNVWEKKYRYESSVV